jgi:hypothetical protein
MAYTSYTYKLRSSGPFAVDGRKFMVHTFKAEKGEVTLHEATFKLLCSEDMTGLGGDYVSASYNGLAYTNAAGNQAFSGSESKRPEYIDEDSIPGA